LISQLLSFSAAAGGGAVNFSRSGCFPRAQKLQSEISQTTEKINFSLQSVCHFNEGFHNAAPNVFV